MSATLDTLTNFAPFWLAGALMTAGYAAVFAVRRTRLALLGLGLLGAAAAVGLIAPEMTRPMTPSPATSGERTVKIIAFNTWDRNADLRGTADWIAAQAPDVVMLEEAGPPLLQTLAARGFRCKSGNGHVAVCSRLAPDRETVRVPLSEWPRLPPFARARFGEGAQGFSVVAVHLARTQGSLSGRQALTRLLARYDRDRLIVAGDFNLTPWSFALRRLDQKSGAGAPRQGAILLARKALAGRIGRARPALPAHRSRLRRRGVAHGLDDDRTGVGLGSPSPCGRPGAQELTGPLTGSCDAGWRLRG